MSIKCPKDLNSGNNAVLETICEQKIFTKTKYV